MNNDEIIALWREAGGHVDGPIVETATIPLDYLPQFVEAVRAQQAQGLGMFCTVARTEFKEQCPKVPDEALRYLNYAIKQAYLLGASRRPDPVPAAVPEALERLYQIRGYDQLDTGDVDAVDVAIDALQQPEQAREETVAWAVVRNGAPPEHVLHSVHRSEAEAQSYAKCIKLPPFGEVWPLSFSLPARAGRTAKSDGRPISWADRFSHALSLIVGQTPPPDMVQEWAQHKSDRLQDWVGTTGAPWWLQNIGAIDAAHAMADAPVEGDESIDYTPPADGPAESEAEICPNCETALPEGCGGIFKDDGDECRYGGK